MTLATAFFTLIWCHLTFAEDINRIVRKEDQVRTVSRGKQGQIVETSRGKGGGYIQGLTWSSNDVDVLQRRIGSKVHTFGMTEVSFTRDGWTLVPGSGGMTVSPSPRGEPYQRVIIVIRGPETALKLRSDGPHGAVETESALMVIPEYDWIRQMGEREDWEKVVAVQRQRAEQRGPSSAEIAWGNVETGAHYLLESSDRYSIGPGLAFTPRIRGIMDYFELGFRAGVVLARGADGGILPMAEVGVEPAAFFAPDERRVFLAVGTGLGMAFQSPSSSTFLWAGGGPGYRFVRPAFGMLDRIVLRYTRAFTEVGTHQFVVAAGLEL